MAQKIFVSCSRSLSSDNAESKKKAVADALCVCPEDIVLVPEGLTVSVIDVPDGMIKGREKADKEAAEEAEAAAEEQAKLELEAIKTQQEEIAKTAAANAPPAPAAVDYDSWTLADLHAEATKREIEGRSGLDKPGLVKALKKSDKKA